MTFVILDMKLVNLHVPHPKKPCMIPFDSTLHEESLGGFWSLQIQNISYLHLHGMNVIRTFYFLPSAILYGTVYLYNTVQYITYSTSVRTRIDRSFTTYVIKHVTFFQSTSRIHHPSQPSQQQTRERGTRNTVHGPAFCSFFYSMNESSNGTLLFQVNMK